VFLAGEGRGVDVFADVGMGCVGGVFVVGEAFFFFDVAGV
jgi:hypothetical protein